MSLNEPEAALISPAPAFVMKTRDKCSGRKIFINVCASDLVEAPHAKSLADAHGQQAIRIPISVGERCEETDKSGDPCDCYDLVISTKSVAEADADIEFKQMVCQIALSALAQKYKMDLDDKFTLPKLKYKGKAVRSQRIRVKRESQIEEVFEASKVVEEQEKRIPPFSMHYLSPDCEVVDGLLLPCYKSVSTEMRDNLRSKLGGVAIAEVEDDMIKLRHAIGGKTCKIQIPLGSCRSARCKISAECLSITFTGISKPFDDFNIFFPFAFSASTARAYWDESSLLVEIQTS